MKKALILLVMTCATWIGMAQTTHDTIVHVIAENDTLTITNATAEIALKRTSSPNGDGGFLRTTWAQIIMHDAVCEKVSKLRISKFELIVGEDKYVFDEKEYRIDGCTIRLYERDSGTRWSSLQYMFDER